MSNDPEYPRTDPLKKQPVPPPLASPLQRPIPLGSLDKPVDLAACRAFFSLTGGSILYCLSALCVVFGVAATLGPIFARSFDFRETLPCLAALNVYELALLAVLVVIVLRRNVTDDAISLVVLSAIFLVVSGIALTTTANSRPHAVLFIGACCLALSMGRIFVLRRFIGMSISPLLWAALAVVLGWNFLAGARLADAGTARTIERGPWLLSGLVLLAGGVLIALDAARRQPERAEAPGRRIPFLRRPAMSWVFALILFFAAGVHQHALAYVFSLEPGGADALPFICVLSLILVHLSRHLRSRPGRVEAALAAIPLAALLLVMVPGIVFEKPAFGAALFWYPPVFFALTGGAVLHAGLRSKCRELLFAAALYVPAVALTLTASAAEPKNLHWLLAGALLVSGLFVLGLVKRRPVLCIAAALVGTAGIAQTAAFASCAAALGLSVWGAALGLAGLGTLAIALVSRMSASVLASASLAVAFCAFDFLPSALGWKDLFAAVLLLALAATIRWRMRRWPSAVILCVPLGWRLALASVLLASWRYVLLGFVLLFAGAWASLRKGRRATSDAAKRADVEPPPNDGV